MDTQLDILVENTTGQNGVFFLIGICDSLFFVSDGGATETEMKDNTDYDCSRNLPGSPPYNCVPSSGGKSTFYFDIPINGSVLLRLKSGDGLSSGVLWFAPEGSNVDLISAGNSKQGISEFTLTTVVSVDISYVQGVSVGLQMKYKTATDETTIDIAAIPNQPCDYNHPGGLRITTPEDVQFPTILSDFYTATGESTFNGETYDNIELARCPGILADTSACTQNACRRFIAETYQKRGSFCDWLQYNEAQAYCWTLDEFICVESGTGKSTDCGYSTDPNNSMGWPTDCSIFLPTSTYPTNVYSCGKGTDLPGPDAAVYWQEAGAIDKRVRGQPTNPNVAREGGTLTITFVDLPWIQNPGPNVPCDSLPPPTPPNPPNPPDPDDGGGGSGNHTAAILGGVFGGIAFIVILAVLLWYFL